jgi:hypothetical protein
MTDSCSRFRVATILSIVMLAFGLRLAAFASPPPLNIDEVRYLVAAHHLRTGLGYSDWRGPETHIHPLHPALTAILGGNITTLEQRGRLISLAASLFLLWPVGWLAWRIGGFHASWVALLLVGAHPWLVGAAAVPQPETLYGLFAACAIVQVSQGVAGKISARRWALAGFCFGLAYLARPEGLVVGLLAGTILVVVVRRRAVPVVRASLSFYLALVVASLPYLIFLRRTLGRWTVTGKIAEIFFIGQAMFDGGGVLPSGAAVRTLMEQWRGVLPFLHEHPGRVSLRAARSVLEIFGLTLPRGLGPAGLAGLAVFVASLMRGKEHRLATALLLAPCSSLCLMLLTFTNQRVIASILPFLFILSAGGLALLLRHPMMQRTSPKVAAMLSLAAAVGLLWIPSVRRAWSLPRSQTGEPLEVAAQKAVDFAADSGLVATNNPVISFYARDPRLFGPSGRYVPLRADVGCLELTQALLERPAKVAVLDQASGTELCTEDPREDCPLVVLERLEDLRRDRVLSLLTVKASLPAR